MRRFLAISRGFIEATLLGHKISGGRDVAGLVSKPIRCPNTDLGEPCQGNLDQGPYRVFRPQEQLSDNSQPGAMGKEFFPKPLTRLGIGRILLNDSSKEEQDDQVLQAAFLADGFVVELKQVDRRASTRRSGWIGHDACSSCPPIPDEMVERLIYARIQQQILPSIVEREAVSLRVVAVLAAAEEIIP